MRWREYKIYETARWSPTPEREHTRRRRLAHEEPLGIHAVATLAVNFPPLSTPAPRRFLFCLSKQLLRAEEYIKEEKERATRVARGTQLPHINTHNQQRTRASSLDRR